MSSSKPQEEPAPKNQKSEIKPIAQIEVKPRERFPLVLGNFATDHSPIGFKFELTPDTSDTFATQIVILKTARGNKFVSYLTNSGKKTVSAKVWQL